ncbi:MAG TPA: hypothetical protein VGQ34_11580 [Sphingomicrobium sp.]|nr:hypothetical protein [Sphingomicrobium sp.]
MTQVNELLTWMDHHPLPFIAATNFVLLLDPAVFRRFVFKIEFKALGPGALERALEHFVGLAASAALKGLLGLTPGDASPAKIVELFRHEAEAKPGAAYRIGF